jgi:predicted RNA binding protein YcfA (HicA-like mRNA interferase family)
MSCLFYLPKPTENHLITHHIRCIYVNVSGKECVKLLKKHGWFIARIQGSHHIMLKDGQCIPVPVHGNTDLAPGTLHAILKKAGLK